MGDDARRELERRIRQGADPADEARWLAERARKGQLGRERLELAAYLGHAPARAALGADPPAADDDAVLRWRAALDEPGRRALVRSAIAALRGRFHEVPSPRAVLAEALMLLEGWARDPGEQRTASVLGFEPRLQAQRDALTSRGELEAAGFARRTQDAARAVCALAGLTFGYDPLEACLRDLRDAGPRAAPLAGWALAEGEG